MNKLIIDVAGENIFAIQVLNVSMNSSDMSGNFYLSFKVNDDSQFYSPPPAWFQEPVNYEESFEQLKGLSGENHKLITATTCVMESKQIWSYISVQDMQMRTLSDEYIKNYIKEIGDKVLNILGAYEIEGKGINLFESIGDDLFSIQGISILQLTKFLRKAGYIE